MKFEGPAPETETRQVSMSFAAFIVAVAFGLFGIAMAVGTMTTSRTNEAPPPETVSAEQASSENVSPPQAAITQPVDDANTSANAQEDNSDQTEEQQAVQEPVDQVASVAEQPKPANPPANALASEPVVTHDPSFPTRHAAAPSPASVTAPVNTVASMVKRK